MKNEKWVEKSSGKINVTADKFLEDKFLKEILEAKTLDELESIDRKMVTRCRQGWLRWSSLHEIGHTFYLRQKALGYKFDEI